MTIMVRRPIGPPITRKATLVLLSGFREIKDGKQRTVCKKGKRTSVKQIKNTMQMTNVNRN